MRDIFRNRLCRYDRIATLCAVNLKIRYQNIMWRRKIYWYDGCNVCNLLVITQSIYALA